MDVFIDANIESFSLSLTSKFPVVSAQDVKSSIFHSGLTHGTIVDVDLWASLLSKTIWIFYSLLLNCGAGSKELEEATDVRLVASLLCVLKDVSEDRVRRLHPEDFLSLFKCLPQAPSSSSVPSVEALQVCLNHLANQASLLLKEKREAFGERRAAQNALRRSHIESYTSSVASITSVDRVEVENSLFDSSIVRLQDETKQLEQFLQVVSASDEANTNDEVDTLLVKLAKKEEEGDLAARYYKVQLKRMLQDVTSRSKDSYVSSKSLHVSSDTSRRGNISIPTRGIPTGSNTIRAIAKEEQASIELVQKALLDFERELKSIASSEAKILHNSNKQELANFESSKNKVGAQIDSLVDYHLEDLKESCKKSVRAFRPLFKRASQVLSSQSIAAREAKFPRSKIKDESTSLRRKGNNKEVPEELIEAPQAEPLVPWKIAVESAFIQTFEEAQKDVNAKHVFSRVALDMERSEASLIRNILSLSTTNE